MSISLVVAMSANRVIGNNNQLPWHLPADLKHFKTVTMGHPIVMGRKTFESIGKPLPGRRNVVVTRQQNLEICGCEVFNSLDNVLTALEDEQEIMIIGGADIFAQSLPMADRIYLTIIDAEIEGDAFLPEWDESDWSEVSRETHQPDDKNRYVYHFIELVRA